jgi:hypothetical protein
MTTVSTSDVNKLRMDQLYKSYMTLGLTPHSENGLRAIPVAHFGAFEVRLIEFADRTQPERLDLWIELYRQDTQTSIDSCRCQDLDEAENLGQYLISQARELYESN